MPRPFVVAALATVVAWAPPVAFGLRWPEYRAARDFISELGAASAPDRSLVNLSFLAAGAYLALGQACSAITGHQAAAFVAAVLIGLGFTAAGSPAITDAAARSLGPVAADLVAPFGFAARLEPAWRGVLDIGAAFYFLLFAAMAIAIASVFASARRGG